MVETINKENNRGMPIVEAGVTFKIENMPLLLLFFGLTGEKSPQWAHPICPFEILALQL